jgi:NADH-quinone oxidoreductase subunit N
MNSKNAFADAFDSTNFTFTLGAFFIVLALFFKLGGYPFHVYVPDVYQASPFITIFFLSVLTKTSFLLVLVKILILFMPHIKSLSYILYISAIGSLVSGCFGALLQTDVKRFIGYTSINQLGFLLSVLSVWSETSVSTLFIYLFIYLSSFIPFIIILSQIYNVSATNEASQELNNFSHFRVLLNNSDLNLSILLALFIFSMMGLPPLLGFFGKYFLFFEILKSKFYFLFAFTLFISVLSSFYYLVFFSQLFFFDASKKKLDFKFFLDSVKHPRLFRIISTCESKANDFKWSYFLLIFTIIVTYLPLLAFIFNFI